MIRVNLLTGAKKGARRKGGGFGGVQLPQIPNVGLLLVVLLVVAEGAGMFMWQTNLSTEANRTSSKLAVVRNEVAQLQKIKDSITALKDETDKLQAQDALFAEIFADKTGPVDALTWLAFVLEPRQEDTTSNDDQKAMEAAGWQPAWDARRAWFTSVVEKEREVTLTGEAIDLKDVAELLTRLQSSPYFRDVQLQDSQEKLNESLKMRVTEFKISGSLVYLIEPYDKPQPAAAPTDAAAGAAGSDADAGSDAGAADGGATGDAPPAPVEAPAEAIDAGAGPDIDAQASTDADAAADESSADAPAPIVPKPAEAKPAPAPEAPARAEAAPTAPKADAPPAAESAANPAAPPAAEKQE